MMEATHAADGDKTLSTIQDRILVVDDDPMIRTMLFEALTAYGYYVELSPGSSDAMEKLIDYKYHLLLLDARIPGMSGFEFLKYCRHHHPDMEIIMITGNPELEDAVSTVKDGAFDYLPKPISIEKLLSRVAAAIQSRQKKLSMLPDFELTGTGSHLKGGTPIPGYHIIRLLGTGAMSTVYLVEREGVKYALKILRKHYSGDGNTDENRLLRFLREADILSKIDHPNIVRIYHAGFSSDGSVPYILMEYVNGKPLTNLIKDGSLELEDKILILRQIARALAAVHRENVLHRDIKPGNILVTDNLKAKLTDFGIAKISDSSLTMTHEVLGSPAYMAPEAFEPNAELSARSDIFSFGVLAYELLTGVKPFHGDTVPAIMTAIRTERPVKPQKLCPELPEAVQNLLARLLKKAPDERYHGMDQVITDLNVVLGNGDIGPGSLEKLKQIFVRAKDWENP